METTIFLLWIFLLASVPLALVVAIYIGFGKFQNDPNRTVIAGFIFFLHLLFSALSLFPMFVLVFAGAHTQPEGNALDVKARLLWLFIEFLYGFCAFSICTWVGGRKTPWPLPTSRTLYT